MSDNTHIVRKDVTADCVALTLFTIDADDVGTVLVGTVLVPAVVVCAVLVFAGVGAVVGAVVMVSACGVVCAVLIH